MVRRAETRSCEKRCAVSAREHQLIMLIITIIIDNNTSNHNFTLPNPSSAFYANKIIYYRNNSLAAGGVGTTTFLTHVPDSNSTCIQSRGLVLFSDSTEWYVIGGF